jgi:hypothetical protein
MTTPTEVLIKMEQVRSKTLSYLDRLPQDKLDWQPTAGSNDEEAWSLGEVFMHLAIDEIYLREMIALPLLEGIKPSEGITFLPPPPPNGTPKATIQFWFQRARLGTQRYFKNWPQNPNLELTHEGGLQEMNGLEWFEGYAGHEAFHHQQIERLIAEFQ